MNQKRMPVWAHCLVQFILLSSGIKSSDTKNYHLIVKVCFLIVNIFSRFLSLSYSNLVSFEYLFYIVSVRHILFAYLSSSSSFNTSGQVGHISHICQVAKFFGKGNIRSLD